MSSVILCLVAAAPGGWTPLFDGRSLSGWEVFTGQPHPQFSELELDRRDAFRVVQIDGEPAIRVAGPLWGALGTKRRHGDYHLRLEYRWGGAQWPPLDFRDSGVLYHAGKRDGVVFGGAQPFTGPGLLAREQGLPGFFPECMEYQIAPRQTGSYGSLGRVVVQSKERRFAFEQEGWNTVELQVVGAEARHYLNGSLVSRLVDARFEGEPLEEGRILLQSEGAEVFFRRIELRELDAFEPLPPLGVGADEDPNPRIELAELDAEWAPLFDGASLAGWERFLGPEPAGFDELDPDPRRVFSVVPVDGEPAIRVNGLLWGGLMSTRQFEDYHLRLEYRWGRSVWPPLHFRDSGLLYHGFGRPGMVSASAQPLTGPGPLRDETGWGGYFLQSMECSISRGYTGGYGSLGPVVVERVVDERSEEKPAGEWNLLELRCFGDEAQHFLNGELVTHVRRARRLAEGREIPLTRGRLQLESQGSEIYFRRIEIRAIEGLDEAR